MSKKSENIIKFLLSAILLICLLDMPYGFYQLVRFLGLIVFGIFAYQSNQKGNQTKMFIYIALAILFQPLFKIYLGRNLWNIVDVVVAVGLLVSMLINKKDN